MDTFRELLYQFKYKDQYIIVDCEKGVWGINLKTMRVFIGQPKKWERYIIEEIISTGQVSLALLLEDANELYIPHRFNHQEKPRFNKDILTEMAWDPNQLFLPKIKRGNRDEVKQDPILTLRNAQGLLPRGAVMHMKRKDEVMADLPKAKSRKKIDEELSGEKNKGKNRELIT